jgi:isoleucyl-tRNA synthetase
MFSPVNSKVNFPQMEENILKLWKDRKAFEQSVERRKGTPRFVLYEGPPTANGSPGMHFAMPRVLKDIIPRYKTMKGYYAPRIGGWDTHGLPVEIEIEKKLGFSGKAQIEEYGIARFNDLCRQSVLGYIKEFEVMTDRIGFWVDMENAYVTFKNEYIETCWWAIKQMWDKGLVYQGYRVTPHCPRCETSLSSHEVAQGYQDDVEDPSVYVKFKVSEKIPAELQSDKPVYLLAWTTTPWTLPGNTALAVAADAEYSVVELNNEYLILASALLGVTVFQNYRLVYKVQGKDLIGMSYEPLFNPHDFGVERRRFDIESGLSLQKSKKDLTYRVIATDFVSMEDGTGIVHVAPAFGEVDYQAGQNERLDFVHTVDLQGNVTGSYPFSGKFVKDADKDILDDLKSRGLLYRSETIRHTYPFCWRCDAPLLYYAKQTWYIRTTALKDRLISGNREINWYPEHIKFGRFGDWLENNVDWALSRERYWGTPLPVWKCESCGNNECISSVNELKSKPGIGGIKEPLDLHRPFVDEITFNCSKCGARMRRVPEVIDCWFDSGAMPIAQSHYPFENQTLLEDGRFPADYICEAVDQTRGWFYALHAISTLLFDRISYKNVICHGLILDAKGEKMSKSRGNVVNLWTMINKYGADALRWYLYTAVPMGNPIRFDEVGLAELSRRFLMTLWNVYSFFITYANIDKFVPDPERLSLELSELDRWILSELNQLIIDVDEALDKYDPRSGAWQITNFIDGLSNWYVRRSRRRFWKSENDADKLSAYNTLYQCLVTLSKLLAPFTPFLAEELYQNLVRSVQKEALDSVHLTDFPVADKTKIDQQLSAATQLAIKVSSLGRAARSEAGINVRQPLDHVVVSVVSSSEQKSLEQLKSQILEELNVKDLLFNNVTEVVNLDGHGYVVGGLEVDREKGIKVPTSGGIYFVAVPTNISSELQAEGMAREIVRRLQTMRRSEGFNITDHIETYYQGDQYVKGIMSNPSTAGYIKQETLSRQLIEGLPGEVSFKETFKISGHTVSLRVKKLV